MFEITLTKRFVQRVDDVWRILVGVILEANNRLVIKGAMCAAEKDTPGFDAMPDKSAITTCAGGDDGIKGALKTIEDLDLAVEPKFGRLVVLLAASFTCSHCMVPLVM